MPAKQSKPTQPEKYVDPYKGEPLPSHFKTHKINNCLSSYMFLKHRGLESLDEPFQKHLSEKYGEEYHKHIKFTILDLKDCERLFKLFEVDFLLDEWEKFDRTRKK